MIKNEIQEQRMRNYFIQATREILKGEGLRHVSVRNIAERAGYSYATLYNYFKDVQELIFLCVRDFQEECREYVISESSRTDRGIGKIKAITRAYVQYFVQYPGTFELFFIEKITSIENKQPTTELIYSFFDHLTKEEWEYCTSQGMITGEKAAERQLGLKLMVTGLLLFYLNRRQPAEYSQFQQTVERQMEFIIKS